MALASPDLLEELLAALQDWEWILYKEHHTREHAAVNSLYEQEVTASWRQRRELALLQAQRRRAVFLRSAAARFVVPAPYAITYWYRDPKHIRKVKRSRGQPRKFDHVHTRPKFLARLLKQRPTAELAKARERAERRSDRLQTHEHLGSYELCEVPDLAPEELKDYAVALAKSRGML